ncbi:MAG: hypothetical protein DWH78_02305 [Planctomycetota bacterium]|nr:MAG: hypothetical protein DWH78_02305 [Planctomycetota bacterium]
MAFVGAGNQSESVRPSSRALAIVDGGLARLICRGQWHIPAGKRRYLPILRCFSQQRGLARRPGDDPALDGRAVMFQTRSTGNIICDDHQFAGIRPESSELTFSHLSSFQS